MLICYFYVIFATRLCVSIIMNSMRKIVIPLLSALFVQAYAQDAYESLLLDGKRWQMEYKLALPPEYGEHLSSEELVMKDDTLVDDIPFKRVYGISRSDVDGELIQTPKGYLIGQKNGCVYQYEENEDWVQKYYPIMDFSLNVGDEFSLCCEDLIDDELRLFELQKYQVTAVSDTVIANSSDRRPRRCIHVKSVYSEMLQDCWVEGIGSLTDGIIGRTRHTYGSSKRLMRCTYVNEVLYSFNSEVSIRSVMWDNRSDDVYYDLQGRLLNGKPSKGVYIKSGRKRVVK